MDELKIIAEVVKNVTEVDFVDDGTRKRNVVDGRMIFSVLARKITALSYARIGAFLGRDHSSVMHYCYQAKALLYSDKGFKEQFRKCEAILATISGGKIMIWSRMNYHKRMAQRLKQLLENG